MAVLGGAKVADKLKVISNLLEKCDTLIIGGGMAYTFLKAQGYEVGTSLVDDEQIDYCNQMMAKAKELGKKLLLPIDAVCAKSFPNPIDAEIEVAQYDSDKTIGSGTNVVLPSTGYKAVHNLPKDMPINIMHRAELSRCRR